MNEPRFQFGDNPSGEKMLASRLEFFGIDSAWDLVAYAISKHWITRPETREIRLEELRRATA